MVTLLAKLFIKEKEDAGQSSVRTAYGMLCGGVGIFLNVILFIGKFLAGTLARSVSVTADAFNNLADAASSVITLLGFKLSRQKPDTEHPFGHGRVEYISGLLVSVAIILMGLELLKASAEKIISPGEIDFSWLTVGILTASILVKLYMFLYNSRIGKKMSSSALSAVAADSLSDCAATGVVLLSTLIAHFFRVDIDGYCGALVALFVLCSGIKSVKETIAPLLGQIPEPEVVKSIERIVLSHREICGIHDLIVHDYGPGRLIVSLHAEMAIGEEYDIFALHDVIDNAERELRDELGCEAVIHMDPVQKDDERTHNLKCRVQKLLHGIDEELSLHDFRIVPGPTHTNLIFDVVVPYGCKLSGEQVKRILSAAVSEMDDASYYAVITIDRPFS